MAIGAVRLLGATVDSLYVSSRPAPIDADARIRCCWDWSLGSAVSLASAASPAREASLVSPVEAMARGEREYAARVHKVRDLWIAAMLAIAGAAASFAPAIAGKPFFGYAAALLLIGASAFAIPALVSGLTQFLPACCDASAASRLCSRRAAWHRLYGEPLCWWARFHSHRHDHGGWHHGRQLPPDRCRCG